MYKSIHFRMLAVIFLLAIFGSMSCGGNILTEFAKTNTDEAYKVEAILLINKGDYNGALAEFAKMSTEFIANREVRILRASAYAGLCGLNFLNFLTAMQSYTGNLMAFLLTTFKAGTAANATACNNAEADVNFISSSAASRTDDENTFMALLSLIKMGTYAAADADVDGDNNGTVDVTFDECNVAHLSDADIREIGVSFVAAANSLAATSISPTLASDLAALCAADLSGLCSVTDPTAFTAPQVLVLRGLIGETTDGIGLGSCGGDIVTCTCP